MSLASLTDRADAGGCVARAREGQPLWRARTLRERAAIVRGAARLLALDADAMAASLAAVTGRPVREIWSSEIVPTLDALTWLARCGPSALAPATLGRSRLQWYFRAARHRLSWEPHGVVGVVTPDTAWLFLAVPQIAGALLAGNAVVWKPAPAGGGIAAQTAGLFHRAGLPPALLQVLPGGADAARGLVRAEVDKLHFTGGSEAGLALYREHAAHGRPAVLELSGGHTSVVLHPCDVRLAARGILWGKRANGGRNCISVQLVLAEPPVDEPLLAALAEAARACAAEGARLGPEERERLSGLADDALARGARHVAGSLADVLILGDVKAGMKIVDEEVQGPILGVARIESGERAVEWVNRRPRRLSASVWGSDAARARRLAAVLDVGQVWLNEQLHPTAQPEIALAGRGVSGFGASRGAAGLMEMAQPKVVSAMPLSGRRRHYDDAGPGVVDLFRGTVRLRFARGVGEGVAAAALLARTVLRLVRGA